MLASHSNVIVLFNVLLLILQVMKDEMELVQQMENVDDRDSEHYIDQLERILSAKASAIGSLQDELSSFQHYRAAMC